MSSKANEYFASVASHWDEMRAGYFTEEMRDKAIEKAHLQANAVVADIGTGTGFLAAGLAPRAAKVYGFDASDAMLEVARRNLARFLERRAEAIFGGLAASARREPGWRLRQHVPASRTRSVGRHCRDGPRAQTRRRPVHH